MRVLVTGGAGFVGRHLCQALLERGDEVVCVDSLVPLTGGLDPARWPWFSPMDFNAFEHHRLDCRDYFAAHPGEGFDVAFHLAALVGGREMIERAPLVVAEDLAIDAAYWRWAAQSRPGKSVNMSSSAAYPVHLQRREGYRLLHEDDVSFDSAIGVPDMTYGWAKLSCEYLAKIAFERHGLHSITYRPFSGYGPSQHPSYPFTAIAQRVRALAGPRLEIWGSGAQMRDFVHIDDCIGIILGGLDTIEPGTALNIASGKLTSFTELAEAMLRVVGKQAQIVPLSDKPEGVFARGGDIRRQETLGLLPKISLEAGVADVIENCERMGLLWAAE